MNEARRSGRGRAGPRHAEQVLERRVEERTRELTALLEVSRSLSSTLALEPLLDLILDQLLQVIDYRSAGIFLARDDELQTVAMRDTRDPSRDRSQVGYRTPVAQRLAVWQVILRGEPIVIGDVRREDDPFARVWRRPSTDEPSPTQSPVRAWMAVPLSARGQVFGMLALTRDVPDSFTAHETELAVAFAGHAAVAIENARLLEQTEQRAHELGALLDVSRTVSATLELEPLLDLILEQLLRVLEYHSASIVVVRGDLLETVASRSTMGVAEFRSAVGYTVPLARALPIWQAMLRGEPFVIGDVHRTADEFAQTWRQAAGADFDASRSLVRAWLNVPLSARGEVFGCLTLTRDTPDSFSDHDIDVAVAFAGHAAVAIDNAGLLDKAEQRTRELSTLLGVAGSLSSTLQLEPLLDVVLDRIKVVADYDGASIVLLEGDRLRPLRRRTSALADTGPTLPEDIPFERAQAWWEVIAQRQPILFGDMHGDEPMARAYRAMMAVPSEQSRMQYVRSYLAAPLALTDRVLGAIILGHSQPDMYTEHEAALATAIATQAAAAIENARLYDEQRRTAQELATVLAVARGAASTLELEPLLNNILDTLKLAVDYDGASIGVVDGDEFRFLESRGASSAEREPEMIGVRLPMRERSGLWESLFRHEPVIIADVRDHSAAAEAFRRTVGAYYDSPAMRYVRSFMAIPLVNRDRLTGLLIMTNREPGAFTERHAGLAMAIATHIAAALENARLYDQTEQRAHEHATLLEVSRSLSSTLALEPLLDLILERLRGVIGYRGASIIVCRDDVLETLASHTMWAEAGDRSEVGYTVSLARARPIWQAVLRGEPVLIGDVRGDDPFAQTWREASSGGVGSPVRAWLGVPLSARGQVFGFLALTRDEPDSFSAHETKLAVAFAGHAAVAIDNARLVDEERRARHEADASQAVATERAGELAALLEVAGALTSTLEIGPLLGVLLDQLRRVADYTGSSVVVVEGDDLVLLDDRGGRAPNEPNPEVVGIRVPLARAGPLWATLSHGESIIVADAWGDEPMARAYREVNAAERDSPVVRHVRSLLAVPLVARGRAIGYVHISHTEPGRFTTHHAHLATAIAQQAAIAIENARLLAESERRARELATLLDVSHAVASTLELRPLLDLILAQLKAVVDYRGATLGTIENEELFIAASRAATPEREADRGMRFPLRRFGPIWEEVSRGEPAIIADVHGDAPAAVEYRALNAALMDGPTHSQIRSWMAVPLALGDRIIGMLSMSQDVPDYFTRHHADLALAFANQAALAIENARLYGEAQGKAALEERQRLARELHDSVSQALFGIALGASAARRRLDIDPAKVGESLDYVLSLADAALTEMRALIFELRPETLEKDGLVAALTRHAAAVRARHEIAVEATLCEEPDLPFAAKEALYRIAQEAMHNAVKHARATRIDLLLTHHPAGIALEVRDDGVGFDPGRDYAGHLGLHSMRERMAAIGGATEITSAAGKGARVHAVVPWS